MTRGPLDHDKASGATVETFSNLDVAGFVGVDTGNCFCEWFDSSLKGDARPRGGMGSELMDNILFPYCSAKKDIASGGPGGSVRLGFYENYARPPIGGAPIKTDVAVFTLTGLPASTSSSSFFGTFRCYFLQVNFGRLICFADGSIGYSWKSCSAGLFGFMWAAQSTVVGGGKKDLSTAEVGRIGSSP